MPAAGGVPCWTPLFYYLKLTEDSEMTNKKFLTYDEQIEKIEVCRFEKLTE
jgi:hypothetical protein